MEFKIYAALHEETNSPWVWLSTPDLPSRSIIKISSEDGERSIYTEYKKIDDNFRNRYNNLPRISISGNDPALVISEWYRTRLAIHGAGSPTRLKVTPADNWRGEFGLYRNHPDRVVHLAVHLGILSVFLGALSVIVTLLT